MVPEGGERVVRDRPGHPRPPPLAVTCGQLGDDGGADAGVQPHGVEGLSALGHEDVVQRPVLVRHGGPEAREDGGEAGERPFGRGPVRCRGSAQPQGAATGTDIALEALGFHRQQHTFAPLERDAQPVTVAAPFRGGAAAQLVGVLSEERVEHPSEKLLFLCHTISHR
ncbi:hypothetical protein SANT12839_025810 [Streptomyces antimycoticus]|uniref:Uncharacterized protein n=1 Tax=Streptomyces antimycoticus TaxID=68175 RepID=A0A4D4K638_9ACTN|nr:hypothetical protein SANT12839_025810 [Streptomyces antimycoticus]